MPLADDDIVLEPTSGSDDVTGFGVLRGGERVGTVALRRLSPGVAGLVWNTPDQATAIAALRLLVDHALTPADDDGLGLGRVEVRIGPDDRGDLRTVSVAGLRREGVVRSAAGDAVLMARLADDPPALSREGFNAILNAGLPTKRVISQGLIRDERGRVLLCELTYKREWDLPGGVVEPGESPALGLVRELEEELGTTLVVRGLVTVNWLPAWRGWDDACIFVFDLGTIEASSTATMTLQPTEIRAVHWCTPDDVAARATAATQELLTALSAGDVPPYREAPLQP